MRKVVTGKKDPFHVAFKKVKAARDKKLKERVQRIEDFFIHVWPHVWTMYMKDHPL